MQNTLVQTACDSCQKVLDGPIGTAVAKEPYIFIKGQATFYEWNYETDWRKWTYLTRKDSTELAFCNGTCLDNYVKERKVWFENYSKNNMGGVKKFDKFIIHSI